MRNVHETGQYLLSLFYSTVSQRHISNNLLFDTMRRKSFILSALALGVASAFVVSLYASTAMLQEATAQQQGQQQQGNQGQGAEDREMRKQKVIDRVRETLTQQGVSRVSALGILGSFQNDAESGEPSWIVSGGWRLLVEPSEGNKTAATVQFRSGLHMVMFDGSAKHTHTITEFALTDWSVEEDEKGNPSVITFNGTATVSLRDGPMEDVPISIKIMQGSAISVWIDPEVVTHFGDTPIYGVVIKSRLPFAE